MESYAGEDLSWWWRGWYAENWQLDLAVSGHQAFPREGAAKGSLVPVEARDQLVMPATLRVIFADGTTPRHSPPGRDLDPPDLDRISGPRPFARRARQISIQSTRSPTRTAEQRFRRPLRQRYNCSA